MTDSERLVFLSSLFDVVFEADIQESFFWNNGTLAVNCNDFFWWGTGDCEPVTPENLSILKQVIADVDDTDEWLKWAGLLFCARVRQMRPQGCCYPKDSTMIALFDACGPKREIDIGNPYQHPEDGGAYAYIEESCQ
jgi:hypothetical protein